MADVKTVSGAFTGSYVINPVSGERIQLWIADYVLAGYGTGAVMGVLSGDQRDWLFAGTFQFTDCCRSLMRRKTSRNRQTLQREGRYINSGFINGMNYAEATQTLNTWLEEKRSRQGKN